MSTRSSDSSLTGTQQTRRSCVYFLSSFFSALITNSTHKFNYNISKYLLINGFFTGNITHTPQFGETMNLNASFFHLRLSIARSRPIMIFAGTDPQLSLIHFDETLNLNYSSAFSCSSFLPCSSVLSNYHLHLSHTRSCFSSAPLRHYRSTSRLIANYH